MSWVQAARSAAFLALRGSKSQTAQVFHQQTRGMGGGGGGVKLDWHRSYDGKAPPAQYQTPDYVTYAGLTLPRIGRDWDYFIAKGVGAVFWFTLLYNFAHNWEEHWHGELYIFERDVQTNGWDDEKEGHSHGH